MIKTFNLNILFEGLHDQLLELQEAMERREETVRELMTKLSESESEQINAKQDATLETKELTEQIKMLQEQLVQVGKAL